MKSRLNFEKTHYHIIHILYSHLSVKKNKHTHAHTNQQTKLLPVGFCWSATPMVKQESGIYKIIIMKKIYKLKRKLTNGERWWGLHGVLYISWLNKAGSDRQDRQHTWGNNKYIQLYSLIRDGTITKYVLRKRASKDVKWIDDSGNSPITDLCGCTSHSWDFQQRISLPDVSLLRVQERFCATELPRPSVRRWELKDKSVQETQNWLLYVSVSSEHPLLILIHQGKNGPG